MGPAVLASAVLLLLAGCRTVALPPVVRPAGPTGVETRLAAHGFPRLANQYHLCCRSSEVIDLFDELHRWDLVVVDAESTHNLPEYLGPRGLLRTRNPNIVVLAYFSAGDVITTLDEPVLRGFIRGLRRDHYLRDADGRHIRLFNLDGTNWTLALNMASGANEYLPRYLSATVLGEGIDGALYDWATTSMSWLKHVHPPQGGAIDIDQDGETDSDEKIDRLWTDGYRRMLEGSRQLFPPGALILGNAGWNTGPGLETLLNGAMIEQFLEGEQQDPGRFGWAACMRTYARHQLRSPLPRASIVMANHDDASRNDIMRFALASTLMFDGYFCDTNRSVPTHAYQTARWFDEYAVDRATGAASRDVRFKGYLGRPLSAAHAADDERVGLAEVLEAGGPEAETRVWRRDFEHGIVLVNPTRSGVRVPLGGSFRRIRGATDPAFNDGSTVSILTLPARGGAILLRNGPGDPSPTDPATVVLPAAHGMSGK